MLHATPICATQVVIAYVVLKDPTMLLVDVKLDLHVTKVLELHHVAAQRVRLCY